MFNSGDDNNGDKNQPQSAQYTSADTSGNKYSLTITENTSRTARYTAQTGDKFDLKVELYNNGSYSVALNYSGVIGAANTAGAAVTLSITVNSQQISITIVGASMTVITGTIDFGNGTSMPAPGPVARVTSQPEPGAETEITGNITSNTTLGVPFGTKNYVYNGSGMFHVENNATLTILPGTTIRFTKSGGGIYAADGATIKADGLPVLLDTNGQSILNGGVAVSGHIRLIGGSAKGSWKGLEIHSQTDNRFAFVDILNAGNGTAAYSSAFYLYNGAAAMNDCSITGSASNGITTYSGGYFTSFDRNAVSNCDKAPIYVESAIWSLRNIGNTISTANTFTGNANQYIDVASPGTLTGNMTIKALTIPWHINGQLTVNESAVLTVQEGTQIKFKTNGSKIYINAQAAIVMDGTQAAPIVLSGVNSNKGAWGSIEVHSQRNENIFDWVELRNGGNGTSSWSCVLYLYDGTAAVTNCVIDGSARNGITTYSGGYFTAFSGNTISNCNKAPIYTESTIWSLREISGNNTFTGNTSNYVHIAASTSITGNMTLTKLSVPYFLEDGLNISNGSNINPTLTIEPGTEIWVNGQQRINVESNSKLVAVGTAAQRIRFRGSTDQAGWWHGITVQTTVQGTKFEYCDILGGGRSAGYSYNNCLFIWAGAYIEIHNAAIGKSNHYGVGFDERNPENAYFIRSSNVTFSDCNLANVWYEDGTTAAALPANNF